MIRELLKDNRGQGGVIGLFTALIIWLALTVAWVQIGNDLITNFVEPVLISQQFGSIGVLLARIAINILWFIIPLILIGAALQGRQPQAV